MIGGAFAIVAELLGVPSLPFAVGIYLPLSTMTPIYVGGLVRYFIEKRAGDDKELKIKKGETGILLGSGFIAGEGIAMVGVAAYAFLKKAQPEGIGLVWPGNMSDFVALGAFLFMVAFIFYKTRK
jgi:uncharacterized oligopeptide transporter (OPT) family protein